MLQEDKEEQSMGKEKPAGGGMLTHKLSGIKPPDGTADDSEQISTKPAGGSMQIDIMSETKPTDGMAHANSEHTFGKPAGGGMPIRKIDGIEHTDAKTSSEQTDVKGSTAHGPESIPKKPPLHCKLTDLFSLKQSVEAEENSGDGNNICKIWEAQSENPKKPVHEIGKSKETEPTSMQVTGEPPTTP